jgi:hypothetical protein
MMNDVILSIIITMCVVLLSIIMMCENQCVFLMSVSIIKVIMLCVKMLSFMVICKNTTYLGPYLPWLVTKS